ncbi:hypothetical protein QR680_006593 [Steinernema hermaphroditum]|uniref:Uncharacterized protein n=1 Tax=Steinernema hermaphroditum TaxID=289476 RepID=A0AA39LXN6_9BILA|nr:hypothetical protein QR680_006593 [Steinernema hermaphroditum]
MFDFMPVLCDLDDWVKEAMFKNALSFYVLLMQSHLNIDEDPHSDKIFVFPNTYVDLDVHKMAYYFVSYNGDKYTANKAGDYQVVGQTCSELMREIRNRLNPMLKELLKFDEDLAAMILLIIIHTNDFQKDNEEWQKPIIELKEVFRELDLHFRVTKRSPHTWGNLMLFLSNLHALGGEYLRFVRLVDLYLGNNMYVKIEREKKVALCRVE